MSSAIKYRVGTMTQRPSEMSAEELKKWQEQGEKEVREYLFSINQPLIYYKNGVLIMEEKDGSIQLL
jgi:membrane-bound lytic murein transglycosylase